MTPTGRDSRVADGTRAASEALRLVAEAVAALCERPHATEQTIQLLQSIPGRVAVTGLGKSGLVAAKLAATLSSTGTAAFFVHAADALHGDAGSVKAGDALIALSNSGETVEVCQFADVVKGRGVPVIAMTGCAGRSTLALLADIRLDVSVAREADPYGIVPSSSTAVAAALGDALAIAMMVAQGFEPADFHRHHPAGSLGRQLSGVEPP